MPRTEDDSWDLASSVGATATMVATSRAMASRGPEPLLDDPYAEPLVRAVGLAPFVRILDGDVSLENDPLLNRKTRTEQMAVRTRFFDDFFTGCRGFGRSAGGDPGLGPRHPRLPAALGRRGRRLRDRPASGDRIQDPHPGRSRRRTDCRVADRRHRSARRLAGRVAAPRVSTSASRPRGAPKDCCPTCRPMPRIDCSTTSPRSAHRAAGWPPSTSPIRTPSPTNACNRSATGGAVLVSTSTQPTSSTPASAASSSTTSPSTVGRWTHIRPESFTPATASNFPTRRRWPCSARSATSPRR